MLYMVSLIRSQHFLVPLGEVEESLAVIGSRSIVRVVAEETELACALIALLEEHRSDFGDDLRDGFGAGERRGLLICQRMLRARLKPLRERLNEVTICSNKKIARALGGNRSR
jgi:hypothetical protein